jgi:GT2 family glycosyltransferase
VSDIAPADDKPAVSIIVVTHNNRELVDPCLRAIFGSLEAISAEVLVVDNASSDGTAQELARSPLPVSVIELAENVGFARAVNVAWEQARGPYVVLVNSDAFPDRGCVERLVEALERRPAAALMGARLRYPSGRLQPSAGTFPSLTGSLWVALCLHRVPGLARLGIGYLASASLYSSPRRVDWVSAALCAARAEAGPMPDSSFMYGEDVAWAAACRARGFEVWLEPAATAVHISRASVERNREAGFAQRRRVQFELAWFASRGPLVRLAARVPLAIHASLRLILYGMLAVVPGRGSGRVREYAALLAAALSRQRPDTAPRR